MSNVDRTLETVSSVKCQVKCRVKWDVSNTSTKFATIIRDSSTEVCGNKSGILGHCAVSRDLWMRAQKQSYTQVMLMRSFSVEQTLSVWNLAAQHYENCAAVILVQLLMSTPTALLTFVLDGILECNVPLDTVGHFRDGTGRVFLVVIGWLQINDDSDDDWWWLMMSWNSRPWSLLLPPRKLCFIRCPDYIKITQPISHCPCSCCVSRDLWVEALRRVEDIEVRNNTGALYSESPTLICLFT